MCNYESNGLTDKAKNQISNTKWYLGTVTYEIKSKDSQGTYQEERSTNVYSGNSQTWDGKVALIYPSDYMYASSNCYNNGRIGYRYDNSTCTSTNWLFSGNHYWTMSPSSYDSKHVMIVYNSGFMNSSVAYYTSNGLRQSVYLDSSVKYIGGDGTAKKAFEIE